MKILIRMDMPCNCNECSFYCPGKEYDLCCAPDNKHKLNIKDYNNISEDCPLQNCDISPNYVSVPKDDMINRAVLIAELARCYTPHPEREYDYGHDNGLAEAICRIRHIETTK